MQLQRFVVDAVVLEGRSIREVARSYGVSKSWVAELVRRYRAGGYEALEPRSRRPRSSPRRIAEEVEEAIIATRKALVDTGLDAGAETIRWHLVRQGIAAPSVSTIWRVLSRRGFVVPEPHKRPRSSFVRFVADLPNECWQADITHWALADGTDVEILDFLDDCSRTLIEVRGRMVFRAPDVVEAFHSGAKKWGYPASVLTDNAAVFNARSRQGRTVLETELESLGIIYKHSRPYHPQTCGKVERVHQTLKTYLARQDPAETLEALQSQIDAFVEIYNHHRPHRSLDRATPGEVFASRERAGPGDVAARTHFRVRTDRVDTGGKVTLRYESRLLHIGIGRTYAGTRIRLYVADLEVRVMTLEGSLIRHLRLDPGRVYQGRDREIR